jgi:hypothetical protein
MKRLVQQTEGLPPNVRNIELKYSLADWELALTKTPYGCLSMDTSSRLLRQLHHLHSAGRPVFGSGWVWGSDAREARWLGPLHHLHSAGRRPASGSGWVWAATRGELAGLDNSIICTLRAAVQHQAPAGCGAATREELAGLDNSIICTLRAAVRHPSVILHNSICMYN